VRSRLAPQPTSGGLRVDGSAPLTRRRSSRIRRNRISRVTRQLLPRIASDEINVTHPSPVCRHATHRETACHFRGGFIRSSLWRITGAPVELRDSPTPNLVNCCAVAGYVLGANRIRVVDYPRLHSLRGTRIAQINVGPTKAVGVGRTARREREDTYAG